MKRSLQNRLLPALFVLPLSLSALAAGRSAPAAQYSSSEAAPAGALLVKNEILTVRLLSPIDTATAHAGDTFSSSVLMPERFRDGIVVGRITKVERAQRGAGKDNAEVQFAFESLTSAGRTQKIAATLEQVTNSQGVRNVDEEGRVIAKSSNKKRIASAAAGGAGGAILGAIRGGTRGAIIGAGAGTAAGYIIGLTMTTSSSNIQFRPGSVFTLQVDETRPAR